MTAGADVPHPSAARPARPVRPAGQEELGPELPRRRGDPRRHRAAGGGAARRARWSSSAPASATSPRGCWRTAPGWWRWSATGTWPGCCAASSATRIRLRGGRRGPARLRRAGRARRPGARSRAGGGGGQPALPPHRAPSSSRCSTRPRPFRAPSCSCSARWRSGWPPAGHEGLGAALGAAPAARRRWRSTHRPARRLLPAAARGQRGGAHRPAGREPRVADAAALPTTGEGRLRRSGARPCATRWRPARVAPREPLAAALAAAAVDPGTARRDPHGGGVGGAGAGARAAPVPLKKPR